MYISQSGGAFITAVLEKYMSGLRTVLLLCGERITFLYNILNKQNTEPTM